MLAVGIYGCSCSERPSNVVGPGLYVANLSVNEGDTGVTDIEFKVNLQREGNERVTVDYQIKALTTSTNALATEGKDATSPGADFIGVTDTLVFEAGSSESETIKLSIINDTL